jgi:mannosyl-oligosaccharide alpha-1,3-glucosidase
MKGLIFLLVIISFVNIFEAANHARFKTCEQAHFCKRNRNVRGSFRVDRTSLSLQPESLSIDLINMENNEVSILTLRSFENDIFHFEVDEKNPLKPRYRVKDVLQNLPPNKKIRVVDSSSEIIVYSGNNKVVINTNTERNFKMEFFYDGIKSLIVNGENLLRFEHLQKRLEPEDPDNIPIDGYWNEEFNGFIDTKLNGPEAIGLDFNFPQAEILFGIPEHADSFVLKQTLNTDENEPYRLFASDMANYELNSRMPLYGNIPVIYGHGKSQTAGVFWLNSADTFVDIHNGSITQFISETGVIDVYVLLGPKPNDAFKQYTDLTGVGTFPPMYTFGMHQSRWNYMTSDEVLFVADNYDKNEIPLDTIWLDIEYTDGKRYFTWNLTAFPNPIDMMNKLRSKGRHLTYIIDPHIKVDENYFFYNNLKSKDYFIKDKNGVNFEDSCWPGLSSWIDYLNPNARQFYASNYLMENFQQNALDTGIW